ncbi:DUF1203 domain-containing protein [Phaeacidiphilus oryzae]|uniref:DUF1203 domain-containing protein n=1 Tax=Phaeacidiphilus oryzae TaxID=348818 RepID=UPI00055C6713|nr:DUF1203 domain-containing protein [Phaeacidiphilus oryzae]
MTSHQPLPIPPSTLKELRDLDDSGRPCRPYIAGSADDPNDSVGSPLRCCLRPVEAGERIALVSYAPLRRWAAETGADPGAYDEAGPVFVHAGDCAGPEPGRADYPFARPGVRRALRRYDARGHIVGGRLLDFSADPADPAESGDPVATMDAALAEAFASPEVVLVHARAVEYGCYLYAVSRP